MTEETARGLVVLVALGGVTLALWRARSLVKRRKIAPSELRALLLLYAVTNLAVGLLAAVLGLIAFQDPPIYAARLLLFPILFLFLILGVITGLEHLRRRKHPWLSELLPRSGTGGDKDRK